MENEKFLGAEVLGKPLHFHRFYLQEFHLVLTMPSQEKSPLIFGKCRGKIIIFKYVHCVLHNKVLFSTEKDFSMALSYTSRRAITQPPSLQASCTTKREQRESGKKKLNSCEIHIPVIQSH